MSVCQTLNFSTQHSLIRFICPIALSIGLYACGNTRSQVQIITLLEAPNCIGVQEGLQIIGNTTDLAQVLDMNGQLEGTTSELDSLYSRHHILSVSEGQKPTTGYSLSVPSDLLETENGALVIPVESVSPGNAITGQMITFPCVILAISPGNYQEVSALGYSLSL